MKKTLAPQTQLNIIGILLTILLGFCAWEIAHPLTWASLVPLALIGYAEFWIVFELTINRGKVPSLATGFIGRRKIAAILQEDRPRKTSYHIIDLGSGRGELTRMIARALPDAHVTGIEMARGPFRQSVFLQKLFGPRNLAYQCLDFLTFDCSSTDAIVFFLTPILAQKAGEKLVKELKPGSLIVSHTFPLLGMWKPIEIIDYRTPFKEKIFVYRKN